MEDLKFRKKRQAADISAGGSSASADFTAPEKISTAKDYENYVSSALEKKEYKHWTSPEQEEHNRRLVSDYKLKKIQVDKASLLTQKDILSCYREKFDGESIRRMSSELGSNKTEIYNKDYFTREISGGHPETMGCREYPSGKICIKDTNDTDVLKHISAHETMHDLSYQSAEHIVHTTSGSDGKLETRSSEYLQSGIEKDEISTVIDNNGSIIRSENKLNRSLNEGLTEMYTVESLQRREDNPGFAAYPMERAWGIALKDRLGEDIVAKAYFSGDVKALEDKFNEMSDIPNAWNAFNAAADGYSRSLENSELKNSYCNRAWDILDSLRH